MKCPTLLLAFAGLVAAQSANTSLADALGANNDTLSTLNSLLLTQPALVQALSSLNDITLLAPSNDALDALLNDTAVASMLTSDPSMLVALLQYHVLNGTFKSTDVTDKAAFIPTLLTNETYTNVTGGQRVEAVKQGEVVSFYSGLKEEANVTKADIEFNGGVIHIINTVLTIPPSLDETALASNLTAAAGALTSANLIDTVNGLQNITVFVPNNAAFSAIASVFGDLSTEALAEILQYHVVAGTVAYSTGLSNTTIESAEGTELRITVTDNGVFVNEAKVVLPDVLIANGVVHVIDSVLNPNNTGEGTPNQSSATPAYSGATPVTDGGIPFTSNVPAPTQTATNLVTESSRQAAPQATAAMAVGAILGGAAMMMNM